MRPQAEWTYTRATIAHEAEGRASHVPSPWPVQALATRENPYSARGKPRPEARPISRNQGLDFHGRSEKQGLCGRIAPRWPRTRSAESPATKEATLYRCLIQGAHTRVCSGLHINHTM